MFRDGLCRKTRACPEAPASSCPPARCWGRLFFARRRLDETWRVVLAIGATAIVAGGAFLAIRFIIGLHL